MGEHLLYYNKILTKNLSLVIEIEVMLKFGGSKKGSVCVQGVLHFKMPKELIVENEPS